MKKDFKNDIENGYYKNNDEIASLIPYLYDDVHYSLLVNSSPNLRRHFAAAIKKYNGDPHTFEEIYNLLNIENFSDETNVSQHEIVRHYIIEDVYMASHILTKFHEEKSTKDGVQELFVLSMSRLYSSFKASALLLNHGFFIEVVSVFRLILEQLAWNCYLLNEETDMEKALKSKTQKTVGNLKVLGEDYKKYYGELSEIAHLEPTVIDRYLDYNEENNRISVLDRSGYFCKEETVDFVALCNAYGELIWKGIQKFKSENQDIAYYKDWYNLHISSISAMKLILNEKAKIVMEKHK